MRVDRQLAEAAAAIAGLIAQMDSRSETAELVRVVLTGRPNSGKSSLFNALAGSTAALVSDQPGTTRDYLIAELDLAGVRCQLIDTAGDSRDGRRGTRSPPVNRAARARPPRPPTSPGPRASCCASTRPGRSPWERSSHRPGGRAESSC